MTASDACRSACPINLALEVIGDRWTLLIIRDMIFDGKRHFCELLASEEAISSNILADRLRKLVDHGILTRADDPTHKQKALYSLTERGIALLPILAQMSRWGEAHAAAPAKLAAEARRNKRSPEHAEVTAAALRRVHLKLPATGLRRARPRPPAAALSRSSIRPPRRR
jgi:DNA-binding HxlR family transcriptional regulator